MAESDIDYSANYKLLSALLLRLSESGATALLKVPRIAVVGNQSAGKSSLIESITGVQALRSILSFLTETHT